MIWKPLIIAGCLLAGPLAHAKQHSSLEKAVEYSQPSLCYFTPPSGWDIADPRSLSPRVKIAFLKSTSNGFCPSINLAIEETSVSLNEYLKAVKAIHEQDRSNNWRALGKNQKQTRNAASAPLRSIQRPNGALFAFFNLFFSRMDKPTSSLRRPCAKIFQITTRKFSPHSAL